MYEILPERRDAQDKKQLKLSFLEIPKIRGFCKAKTPKMLLSLASRQTEYAIVIMIMYIPVEIPFVLCLLFGKFLQQTFPKPWKVCNIFAQLFGFRECATERRKATSKCQELQTTSTNNLVAQPRFKPFIRTPQLPASGAVCFWRFWHVYRIARAELKWPNWPRANESRAPSFSTTPATFKCFVSIN